MAKKKLCTYTKCGAPQAEDAKYGQCTYHEKHAALVLSLRTMKDQNLCAHCKTHRRDRRSFYCAECRVNFDDDVMPGEAA